MAKITFAGICTWVDPTGGDRYSRVILPNGETGLFAAGRPIPPHVAFIDARRSDVRVNLNEWGRDSLATLSEVLLFLKGVDITFSHVPEGSPREMRKLNRVREGCPDADVVRDGFLNNPDPSKVSAIAHVRNGASGVERHRRAKSAFLTVPVGTRIITQAFGGGARRAIEIARDDAHVIIGNADLTGYLLSIGDSDDNHRLLHCKSFAPRAARTPAAVSSRRERLGRRGERLTPRFDRRRPPSPPPIFQFDSPTRSSGGEIFAASLAELTRLEPGTKAELAEKIIGLMKSEPDFLGRLDTLADGCRNEIHP